MRESKKKSSNALSEVSLDVVVIMIYKDERVLVPRPNSHEVRPNFLTPATTSSNSILIKHPYQHARIVAAQTFLELKDVPVETIAFFTDTLSVCESKATRISPLVWDIVMKRQIPLVVALIKRSEEPASQGMVSEFGLHCHLYS
jgi:hypothetical protein